MQCWANLEGVLAGAAEATLVVDESGAILFATDEACHLLKYSQGELCGQTVELLIPSRFRLAHIGHRLCFTDARRTRPMGAGLALFALCKDGSELSVELSLTPIQRGLENLTVVGIHLREAEPSVS